MPHHRRWNWGKYNEQFVQRGEMLLWIDALRDRQQQVVKMTQGKRGRPFLYPTNLMVLFGMIHAAFRLPYRQLKGLAGLRKLLASIPAPDYTLRFTSKPHLNPNELVILAIGTFCREEPL